MSNPPTAARLLGIWLTLGVLSFGGGATTLALIRRAAVEEQQWVTEAEFGRFSALMRLAPGINLLALAILIGRKIAGVRGIALALAGLLLPSVSITIALTAGYAQVQHALWMRAALRGIVPAVVGLGLMTAWQIAVPPLQRSRREGTASFGISLALLLGSALTAWHTHLPVVVILLGAAIVSAVWTWWRHQKARAVP